MQQRALPRVFTLAALTALIAGCNASDEQLLRQSLRQQAEQNAQMARHTQQIVETSGQLIEADARARGDLVELQEHLQQGVQAERRSLDRQHQELETERQAVARQRQRDPLIAAAIVNASILLACVAPLLLAYWVIRSTWTQESGAALDELLVRELITEASSFLPRPTLALPLPETAPDPQPIEPGGEQPRPETSSIPRESCA